LTKRINLTKNNLQTYVGKKIIIKGITMLKKNLTKQNVQTVLAVGLEKNPKNDKRRAYFYSGL
jgi:hypothetical protein